MRAPTITGSTQNRVLVPLDFGNRQLSGGASVTRISWSFLVFFLILFGFFLVPSIISWYVI